jgi:hypothetical protein
MATLNISDISRSVDLVDLNNTSTVLGNVSYKGLTVRNIATGALAAAVALSTSSVVSDLKPYGSNVISVEYANLVSAESVLSFRLTITNIGIEGYSADNPPGIGIQVIGFSNYIL